MKQVSQDKKTGQMVLLDVPPPALLPGGVLVRTACSLISSGTERNTVESGREGLFAKARRQPEKVRELLDQALTQGVGSVVEKIQGKLGSFQAIGYSASGVVTEVGPDAGFFRVGDRVACAGSRAPHAEILSVPSNLCALVPAGVGMDQASITTLGAIALQGIRQADVRLGESVAVIGLGLLGQLTAQMLRASGCSVLGCDLATSRVELALRSGASMGFVPGRDDPRAASARLTRGFGFDAVIVTASTPSNAPLVLAGELARDRARVVIVGLVGGEVPRSPYYEKELSVLLSRSYGPGRYDPVYEDHGVDYPIGYVRWTENRNMEAFLEMVARGNVDLSGVLTHRYPVDRVTEAYAHVTEGGDALGIVLEYSGATQDAPTTTPAPAPAPRGGSPTLPRRSELGIGVIGAGSFAQGYLLPHLKRDSAVRLRAVTTGSGLTARQVAGQFGFERVEDSAAALLEKDDVQAVVIATRHDSHAALVCQALRAGKSVFVEKPLALTADELDSVERALSETGGLLAVGFNRRFAPMIREFKAGLGAAAPLGIAYRVNAGPIPANHWTQDPRVGGGRILGEACHFFDLLAFLAGAPITRVSGESFPAPGRPAWAGDDACFLVSFANGGAGTLGYWASGHKSFPKEQLEIFGGGFSARMDDFREAVFTGGPGARSRSSRIQDKGHAEEMRLFALAARGEGPPPIPHAELLAASRVTLLAARSLAERRTFELTP